MQIYTKEEEAGLLEDIKSEQMLWGEDTKMWQLAKQVIRTQHDDFLKLF